MGEFAGSNEQSRRRDSFRTSGKVGVDCLIRVDVSLFDGGRRVDRQNNVGKAFDGDMMRDS